jgi:hypothetical protein
MMVRQGGRRAVPWEHLRSRRLGCLAGSRLGGNAKGMEGGSSPAQGPDDGDEGRSGAEQGVWVAFAVGEARFWAHDPSSVGNPNHRISH